MLAFICWTLPKQNGNSVHDTGFQTGSGKLGCVKSWGGRWRKQAEQNRYTRQAGRVHPPSGSQEQRGADKGCNRVEREEVRRWQEEVDPMAMECAGS